MRRKEFRELVPPERVESVLQGFDISGGAERVSLADSRGRVLAERVDARMDVPGFDRASMDGYAVKARDTFGASETQPVRLELLGVVHAGMEPEIKGEHGGAIEISTGAVMPPGTDAVVMVERTEQEGERITVTSAVAPGENIMAAGADISAGARGLGAGTVISPREIGLLSALGINEVSVVGKPTVGIVSTGNELVEPGAELDHAAGEIHDVNSYTIAAGIEEAGGSAKMYPLVEDTYEALFECLTVAGEECDLVLSSGSTSAGSVDLIHQVISEDGELLIHGVAVKPGKPMMIGSITETPFVGLPGYPVSALTIFQRFVAPIIRDAASIPSSPSLTVEGRMAVRERYAEGRLRFMPVGLVEATNGESLVYPVDKGSGATTSLVEGDGFVEIPPETAELRANETVTVKLFSETVTPPSVLCVGEDDPVFSSVLDELQQPRFLHVGTAEGVRRLREGVPDAIVVSGPSQEQNGDNVVLGEYYREWGIIVEAGNPKEVSGIDSLVSQDLTFVNRSRGSGLRDSFDEKIRAYGEEHGDSEETVKERIVGYETGVKAHASPARQVMRGVGEAGLGLRVTTDRLGVGFVPLGHERVRVVGNPDRRGKPGVRDLEELLSEMDRFVKSTTGYRAEPVANPT